MDGGVVQTRRYDILKVKFDLIAYHVVMNTIKRWKQLGEKHYVTITNPHSVMLSCRDAEMRKATDMAGMTLPDGVGIVLAASILGYPHNGRATGPMLMLKLCDWGRENGYRHYFYGGDEGVADRLTDRLTSKFSGLKVAGTYCPPFRELSEKEDRDMVDKINATMPDIVWVGLGAPKQEKWMADHVGKIQATAMIGVGAAFDFHSGKVKWAPTWIRRIGMEWAYRLIHEPKRMLRRNLDSPIFVAKVINQRLKQSFKYKRINPELHLKQKPISFSSRNMQTYMGKNSDTQVHDTTIK